MKEEIKIHGLFKSIKYAWQRAVRGYDERIMWGFSDYFNQCIPALKEFCEKEIPENEEYNPDRVAIYKKTLELITAFEKMPSENYWKHPNEESELWKFVGEHIGWYWD